MASIDSRQYAKKFTRYNWTNQLEFKKIFFILFVDIHEQKKEQFMLLCSILLKKVRCEWTLVRQDITVWNNFIFIRSLQDVYLCAVVRITFRKFMPWLSSDTLKHVPHIPCIQTVVELEETIKVLKFGWLCSTRHDWRESWMGGSRASWPKIGFMTGSWDPANRHGPQVN